MMRDCSFEENLGIQKALLDLGMSIEFTLSGSSMVPTFHSGDKIKVRRHDCLTVGKIYVYVYNEEPPMRFVCHRLKSLTKDTCTFCGDNRTICDKPVARDAVLGEVVENE